MKKTVILLIILSILLVSCISNGGEDDLRLFRGIPAAEVPGKCLEHRDDVCGLYDCMVDRCWCDEARPEGPILYETTGISIQTEEEAMSIVKQYVQDSKEYGEYSNVKRAVKLNNVFFNVFAENENYDEKVFTVATDGTIILTMCGV